MNASYQQLVANNELRFKWNPTFENDIQFVLQDFVFIFEFDFNNLLAF